jgi:hypothetical protein
MTVRATLAVALGGISPLGTTARVALTTLADFLYFHDLITIVNQP